MFFKQNKLECLTVTDIFLFISGMLHMPFTLHAPLVRLNEQISVEMSGRVILYRADEQTLGFSATLNYFLKLYHRAIAGQFCEGKNYNCSKTYMYFCWNKLECLTVSDIFLIIAGMLPCLAPYMLHLFSLNQQTLVLISGM